MSANIDESTGKPAIAFVGETPWHGLGERVPANATIEQVEEAAQLGWGVKLTPAMYRSVKDGPLGMPQFVESKYRFLLRDDTGAALTMVGPDYVPFQNRQILDFFRQYLEAGDMTIETAGSLNGGQNIWALAKLGVSYTLPGDDKNEGYVLLMNPHQYGKGMTAKLTEIRVVCQNTMTMALGGRGSSVQLWHNRELTDVRLNEVRDRLNLGKERFSRSHEDAVKLSQAKIDAIAALNFSYDLFAPKAERADDDRTPKPVARVMELFNGAGKGAQLESANGTAWGLLNAVTQYLDWDRGRSNNSRLSYSWLGGGEKLKTTARNRLLQLVG